MSNNQTQTVADRRLEEWLTQWGEVECERIHGGILPDKRGETSNSRKGQNGIPNFAACHADVERFTRNASTIVKAYLVECYAMKKARNIADYVLTTFGADIPEHLQRRVVAQVERNYREWRKDTAAALNL